MIQQVVTAVYLLVLAIIDMFMKRIDIRVILCGTVPLVVSIWTNSAYGFAGRLLGLVIGGVIYLLSHLTKEKIGKGDALILCFIGMIIGAEDELMLIGTSLLISAFYSISMLAIGRIRKNDRIAFVPFLFFGYLMIMFLKG